MPQGRATGLRSVPEGLWVQCPTVEAYRQAQEQLFAATADSDGSDHLVIFIRDPKAVKVLPDNRNVRMDEELKGRCLLYTSPSPRDS